MEQGVLGSSLTATSWRGFLFLDVSGLYGYRTLFFTVWYVDRYTRVLLYVAHLYIM